MSPSRPLSVVFTMTFAERLGGCEAFLWTFLRHVDRARIAPHVVFHAPGPLAAEVEGLGIPATTLPPGRFREPSRGLRAMLAMRRLIRRVRPDLVVSWYSRAHLYTAPAAVAAGAGSRLAWFQHSMPGITDLDGLVGWMPARAVLANSEAVAAAQARRRPGRTLHVVYPGIDEPARLGAGEAAQLRERLGIPPGRVVVGVVGRLQALKRQHLAIEAVERLRSEGRDAHCLVVGGAAHGIEPGYQRSLREAVARRGLESRVTFTGQVPDATGHIQAIDVLVNTTTSEGLGMTLVEALAVGTPAVAFDGPGGQAEALDGGRCGLLARDGDAEDLARQAGRLLDEPDLRADLTARGRARFERTFRADAMAAALEEKLELIARGR